MVDEMALASLRIVLAQSSRSLQCLEIVSARSRLRWGSHNHGLSLTYLMGHGTDRIAT